MEFGFSEEKDVDSELIGKDVITAQPLTIVEDDGSLSPDETGAIATGLLDNGDEEITYQIRSAEGGLFMTSHNLTGCTLTIIFQS